MTESYGNIGNTMEVASEALCLALYFYGVRPRMNVLLTIADVPVSKENDGSLLWISGMEIDNDGSGPSLNDPDYQDDTSLHFDGKPLDAEKVPYIVVPPGVIQSVPGIVLGCKARVYNLRNDQWTDAVVGDVGPRQKIGEASICTANRLGVPSSPTTGGIADHVIAYKIWPGVPALVDGVTYQLKASA